MWLTKLVARLRSSLIYRGKWALFGPIMVRSLSPTSICIAGRRFALSFPNSERSAHEWEFVQIVFNDCYRLAKIAKPVRTVLDIGANVGLFALGARLHFPQAAIYCYEPNPALEPHLRHHAAVVGAHYFMEAVGKTGGAISLRPGENSLVSVAVDAPEGDIPRRAFADILARVGAVDVLKLDCEGAEWDLLTDPAPWRNVRSLVMEYHLWARPGATIDNLKSQLAAIGFENISVPPNYGLTWGFAFAHK